MHICTIHLHYLFPMKQNPYEIMLEFFFLWSALCGEHCVCFYCTFFSICFHALCSSWGKKKNPTTTTNTSCLQDYIEQSITCIVYFIAQVACTAHPVMLSCGSKGTFCGVVLSHLDNYIHAIELLWNSQEGKVKTWIIFAFTHYGMLIENSSRNVKRNVHLTLRSTVSVGFGGSPRSSRETRTCAHPLDGTGMRVLLTRAVRIRLH